MMGYQSGDDGMPGRGGVTTLTSHQSGILHPLIFKYGMSTLYIKNVWSASQVSMHFYYGEKTKVHHMIADVKFPILVLLMSTLTTCYRSLRKHYSSVLMNILNK